MSRTNGDTRKGEKEESAPSHIVVCLGMCKCARTRVCVYIVCVCMHVCMCLLLLLLLLLSLLLAPQGRHQKYRARSLFCKKPH